MTQFDVLLGLVVAILVTVKVALLARIVTYRDVLKYNREMLDFQWVELDRLRTIVRRVERRDWNRNRMRQHYQRSKRGRGRRHE